jgi:hypothetical protein
MNPRLFLSIKGARMVQAYAISWRNAFSFQAAAKTAFRRPSSGKQNFNYETDMVGLVDDPA